MKDKKVLDWLEKNMNKQHLFYFRDNDNDENIIDCYFKKNNKHFCIFYRQVILKCIDENIEISN
ncbi:hypothetical protein [uncultured Rikenella sp.]|uniref:hypothetical protein n=1 Tax=uncultured Rikenella sp. TaxID=368003 RepID=UPI0026267026|nr:hypothetical protein [uncultured Rikenella sp.]